MMHRARPARRAIGRVGVAGELPRRRQASAQYKKARRYLSLFSKAQADVEWNSPCIGGSCGVVPGFLKAAAVATRTQVENAAVVRSRTALGSMTVPAVAARPAAAVAPRRAHDSDPGGRTMTVHWGTPGPVDGG